MLSPGIVEQLQSPGRVVVACAFDYEAIEVHRQLQSFTTKLDNMMLLVAHVGISHMELIGKHLDLVLLSRFKARWCQ
jgi:hypothetical protein